MEELLKKVQNREIKGYINVINLTEFYYILYRRNPAIAEEKVRNLKAYGLEVVYVSDDRVWREAGKIKAVHGMPLADAFAVATAVVKNDKLVVGRDEDFRVSIPMIKVR